MTQNEAILKALREGRTLDPLGVLGEFDCWSLRSRISEIEGKSGHARMLTTNEVIARGWAETPSGKRHRTYSLVTSKSAAEFDRLIAGAK